MLAQWIQFSDYFTAFSINIWKSTMGSQNSNWLYNVDNILIGCWELLMILQNQASSLEKGYARVLLCSNES